MIKSMTGFGKSERANAQGAITVEIRTLNHKFFEMMAHLPGSLSELEDKTKDVLQGKIKRGRAHVSINLNSANGSLQFARASINTELAKKYRRMLDELKNRLKVKDDIGLSHVIALPNVIEYEKMPPVSSKMWPAVKEAIEAALEKLLIARSREGALLYKDIMHHIKLIHKSINVIKLLEPGVLARYRAALLKIARDMLKDKNANLERRRLEEEVARFARDCDIREELTRLTCHLSAFEEALRSNDEVGRRLDFITQELHREANTIAAKANDYKIQEKVIDIKSAIEKIREQVQNVE